MAPSVPTSGSARNAWPEYQGKPADVVKSGLESSGQNAGDVFVWPAGGNQSPPINPGTEKSIWLYTLDGTDIVYHIPVRGVWHPNRSSPGWPELVGVKVEEAIAKILAEVIGFIVFYGPPGAPATADYRTNRVRVIVGKDGKVENTPAIG